MNELIGQLDIPQYFNITRKNKNPLTQEDPIGDQMPKIDPEEIPVPPEIDPIVNNVPMDKEPPLSQEDELDPSKNPVKEAWQRGEVWM